MPGMKTRQSAFGIAMQVGKFTLSLVPTLSQHINLVEIIQPGSSSSSCSTKLT